MWRLQTLLTATLLTGTLSAIASAGSDIDRPEKMSLSQLEKRLAEIDAELSQLAPTSLRSGVGAVGYQSTYHKTPNNTEWAQIDLGEEFLIDQIVLVPNIERDSKTGLQAEGFPVEFRILAGTTDTSHVVASFTAEDNLLPRIAPVAVQIAPLKASWVRLECTLLSPSNWANKRHELRLSEMMVFSGKRNVALQKPVEVSSSHRSNSGRHERFLVDGFVPYLMDAMHGNKSPARALSFESKENSPTFTIDLGESFSVNQINLHAVDLSHTIPQSITDDYAIPRLLRVTGANRPDFSDQVLLFEYERKSIYDAGPIIRRNFPETRCRYIRITALEDQTIPSPKFPKIKTSRIGFAEIEIFANHQNKALGRPVTADPDLYALNALDLTLQRITDGNNLYGEILPIRNWMDQLARRHDLEAERPQVFEELSRRYAQQKTTLKWSIWIIALLLGSGIILVLIEQILRQRAVFRTRERIAANLHDELGANLHAIGLLGDTAKKVVDQKNASEEWSDLIEIIDDVRDLTEETGSTARFCSNMLEADGLYQNLVEDMRRMADRLLADLEHDFSVLSEDRLHRVSPRRRVDLMLFYKECLTNIIRHSGATVVSTQLSAEKKEISLCISDNGGGTQGEVPSSLKRRARLLGGSITAASLANGGTLISLSFRPRRRLPTWRVSDFIVSKLESRNRKN